MKAQNQNFLFVSIFVMKYIIKHVSIKKTVKKYTHFFSADIYLRGRVIKAVICKRVVILLQLCSDMIDKILTFHLIPNLSQLEHVRALLQGHKCQRKILAVQ